MKHGGLAGRIALNPYFRGSHFHHLGFKECPDFGVYIPIKLHRRTMHNSTTGYNMEEINSIAYKWLIEKYEINFTNYNLNPMYNDFIELSNELNKKFDIKYITDTGLTYNVNGNNRYSFHTKFPKDEAEKLIESKETTRLNWSNFLLVKSGIIQESDIVSNKIGKESKISKDMLTIWFSVSYLEGMKLQQALQKSRKSSWRDYILHITKIKNTPTIPKDYLTSKQLKEIEFKKRMDKANINELKCLSCENMNYWWCKTFKVDIINMAGKGIKFETCQNYKYTQVQDSHPRHVYIQINGPVDKLEADVC